MDFLWAFFIIERHPPDFEAAYPGFKWDSFLAFNISEN